MEKKCRFCKSTSIVKRGQRYNEVRKKQLYFCKDCNKKFTQDDGLLKYRHSKKTIMLAVKLYEANSSWDVQRIMKSKGISVSRWTIVKWHRRFSN
jgi:transposase-like protein